MIKLKQLLFEIGNRINMPDKINFNDIDSISTTEFNINGDKYEVTIKPLIVMDNKIGQIVVSFMVNNDNSYKLTNNNDMLLVMSYVYGSIELWFSKVKEKFPGTILYAIRFEPKQEVSGDTRRKKIYIYLIQDWLKKKNIIGDVLDYNGDVTIKFSEPFIIK